MINLYTNSVVEVESIDDESVDCRSEMSFHLRWIEFDATNK